jgi:hypothetical protein
MLCFTQWVKKANLSYASGDINKVKNISRLQPLNHSMEDSLASYKRKVFREGWVGMMIVTSASNQAAFDSARQVTGLLFSNLSL